MPSGRGQKWSIYPHLDFGNTTNFVICKEKAFYLMYSLVFDFISPPLINFLRVPMQYTYYIILWTLVNINCYRIYQLLINRVITLINTINRVLVISICYFEIWKILISMINGIYQKYIIIDIFINIFECHSILFILNYTSS